MDADAFPPHLAEPVLDQGRVVEIHRDEDFPGHRRAFFVVLADEGPDHLRVRCRRAGEYRVPRPQKIAAPDHGKMQDQSGFPAIRPRPSRPGPGSPWSRRPAFPGSAPGRTSCPAARPPVRSLPARPRHPSAAGPADQPGVRPFRKRTTSSPSGHRSVDTGRQQGARQASI